MLNAPSGDSVANLPPEMVEPLHCKYNGRPSVGPVSLFKMMLIHHLYGLPPLLRTVEEINGSIYYRWFWEYSLQGKHHIFPRRVIISSISLSRRQ